MVQWNLHEEEDKLINGLLNAFIKKYILYQLVITLFIFAGHF